MTQILKQLHHWCYQFQGYEGKAPKLCNVIETKSHRSNVTDLQLNFNMATSNYALK
jgi:hypothetical protein